MDTMADPIEFRDVSKSRSGVTLFEGLTLTLPGGATSVLVGESGSGKSTLLELINGLLIPEHGEVRVFGQPLPYRDLTSVRKRIGYAVQGIGLFPHLTVHDNISLVASLAAWPRERMAERVQELMELMALSEELSARFPHELSGGQQQRAGICRAMMTGPEILLLDEPFSGIDPINRQDIHRRMTRLVEDAGTTVVLVTHDVAEALALAGHLVVVKDGHVVAAGRAAEVREASEPYVNEFLQAGLG